MTLHFRIQQCWWFCRCTGVYLRSNSGAVPAPGRRRRYRPAKGTLQEINTKGKLDRKRYKLKFCWHLRQFFLEGSCTASWLMNKVVILYSIEFVPYDFFYFHIWILFCFKESKIHQPFREVLSFFNYKRTTGQNIFFINFHIYKWFV